MTHGVAVLRFGGTVDGTIQAAVWDRLLAMSASFFQGYTVGDLTDRFASQSRDQAKSISAPRPRGSGDFGRI